MEGWNAKNRDMVVMINIFHICKNTVFNTNLWRAPISLLCTPAELGLDFPALVLYYEALEAISCSSRPRPPYGCWERLAPVWRCRYSNHLSARRGSALVPAHEWGSVDGQEAGSAVAPPSLPGPDHFVLGPHDFVAPWGDTWRDVELQTPSVAYTDSSQPHGPGSCGGLYSDGKERRYGVSRSRWQLAPQLASVVALCNRNKLQEVEGSWTVS